MQVHWDLIFSDFEFYQDKWCYDFNEHRSQEIGVIKAIKIKAQKVEFWS